MNAFGHCRVLAYLCQRSTFLLAVTLIVTAMVIVSAVSSEALAQTEPAKQGATISSSDLGAGSDLAAGAAKTEATSHYYTDAKRDTTIVQEAAEQNKDGVLSNVTAMLLGQAGQYNDVYFGLDRFWSDDIVSNLFPNIGQLFGKWLMEFLYGWVADTVQFLSAFARIFVLNPNIPVNGLGNTANGGDDISRYIASAADFMYEIAVDLLLLLFILAIWRFWAEAAWRGGGNLMGAVGRLIFTAGLLLAWPTIFAFEITITNEMIKAIYFNSADQLVQLDSAMAAAVKGGLVAGAGGLAHVFAPVIGSVAGGAMSGELAGMVLGTVGELVSFAGLVIYTIMGIILIAELMYFLILKAIQTALLTAQYMFAPIFLVCFASPDTESYASGYVKAWIETSLWTFVWVGLFKILVVILYSNFNPWGQMLMLIGVLQLMIQVPSFMSRAMISPMSDFVSAGLVSALAFKGLGTLAQIGGRAMDRFAKQVTEFPAMYPSLSQATTMNALPVDAANPELLSKYRAASQSTALNGQGVSPPLRKSDGQSLQSAAQVSTNGATLNANGAAQDPAKNAAYSHALTAARSGQAFNLASMRSVGGANAAALAALTGATAGIGRALSPAGVERGMLDPTLFAVSDDMQRPATDGTKDEIDGVSGVRLPGPRQSGLINAAEGYNHAGYKFVQAKIAAVNARTYGGTSIGFSSDGTNKLVGDGRGNLRHMRARKGATPEEVAHLVMAGGFTELLKDDSEAVDAARNAAVASGAVDPDKSPRGLSERIAAGWLGYNGRSFRETALAKQRFSKAMFEQAALGSEAYVSGGPGNAYSDYLKNRFGEWTANDDTWAVHIMTDSSLVGSPWNAAYSPATDALVSGGTRIDERNRAASGNQHVMRLPAWQRKTAIPAVRAYATQIAEAMYPGAEESVLDAAVMGITADLGPKEVEAATAIFIAESGAQGISIPVVQAVADLCARPGSGSAEEAYRSLRSAVKVVGGGGIRQRAVVDVQTASGGAGSTDYNFAGQMAGDPGDSQIDVEVRAAGGGSTDSVETIHAQGLSSPGQSAQVHVHSAGVHQIERARQVVMQMYDAGMRDSKIQDERVVSVAHHFYENHPHMMHSVAVAVETMPVNELSTDAVYVIDSMLSSGYSRGQISRVEVEAAQQCMAQKVEPTPRNVSNWRKRSYSNPRVKAGPPGGYVV